MAHTKKGSVIPRFQVGDKVRVKYGVIDPDFPDIPLGGWTGCDRAGARDYAAFLGFFSLDPS